MLSQNLNTMLKRIAEQQEAHYEDWKQELKEVLRQVYNYNDLETYRTVDLGDWQSYFDEGYTPYDAIKEDFSYGD